MLDKALTRCLTPHSLQVKDCPDPLCISVGKHPEGLEAVSRQVLCGGVSVVVVTLLLG